MDRAASRILRPIFRRFGSFAQWRFSLTQSDPQWVAKLPFDHQDAMIVAPNSEVLAAVYVAFARPSRLPPAMALRRYLRWEPPAAAASYCRLLRGGATERIPSGRVNNDGAEPLGQNRDVARSSRFAVVEPKAPLASEGAVALSKAIFLCRRLRGGIVSGC